MAPGDSVEGGVVEVVLEHDPDLVRALHARVQATRGADIDQLAGPRATGEGVGDRQRRPHLADAGHQYREVGDRNALLFEPRRRAGAPDHGADEFPPSASLRVEAPEVPR